MCNPKYGNKSSQNAGDFLSLTSHQQKMGLFIEHVKLSYIAARKYAVIMLVSAAGIGITSGVSGAGEHPDAYRLETITVTAPNKVPEEIQKTPTSIQYFSGDALDDAKVDDVYDLLGHTSNIHSRHNAVHHSLY